MEGRKHLLTDPPARLHGEEQRLRPSPVSVLLIAPHFPYPAYRDGSSMVVARLLRRNEFFTADILCPVESSDQIDLLPPGVQLHRIPDSQNRAAAWLTWLANDVPRNVAMQNRNSALIRRRLLDIHAKYDVVHVISHLLLPILDGLDPLVRRKMIIAPLDCYSLLLERRRNCEVNHLLRVLLSWELAKARVFERRYYSMAAPCIFISDVDRDTALNLGQPIDASVIPAGIDTEYFAPHARQKVEKSLLLFGGNMSYAPNVDAAVFLAEQVMPIVRRKIPSAHLRIVGAYPTRKVKALANTFTEILGYVPDMRVHLAACQLYVCPLRFGSGMKNKVLEAMAMAKPVIASRIASEGICWNGDAPFFEPVDMEPDTWASAIIRLLQDEIQLSALGAKARELVKKQYSVVHELESYARLYEDKRRALARGAESV